MNEVNTMNKFCGTLGVSLAIVILSSYLAAEEPVGGFPYKYPDSKPDRPLSAAMERNYTAYPAPRPENNELYTQFKFTRIEGFDYHGHDGTISRRDPSKVIFVDGIYFVWYTKRDTPTPPQGAQNCTDTIPSADWDLADIWYATSEDGFNWKEQGVAVPRPPKPNVGWRSVTTTDILVWEGKYYLYYQGFMEASGLRGDDCPVAVSSADSPAGPWTPANKIVIPNGAEGEWDQFSIHDPYPLVHDGKIYLYYKSDSNGDPYIRMQGLAIAEHPLGPFKKHPLNPVVASGHETTLFPFKAGVAALVIRDGNEHNTIQYAEDWVNFEVKSIVQLMPDAGGPFVHDAFTNTKNGRGITWGLSHFTNATGNWKENHSILARFDCDLSLDVNDPAMKKHHIHFPADVYFSQGLSQAQRQRADPLATHPNVAAAIEQIDAAVADGPFQPNWDSLAKYEIPQWYKDAKFGIFVHWGVFSVPAYGSEWYPRQMYIDTQRRGDNFFQHHIDTHGPQSKFGYKDFIPMFKAEKFDANEWADLFAQAGAKYVVPVAEHHDGFPMYDCSFTEWDATGMGPQRDIIAELGKAIRGQGMKMGLSSHRAFNWKYYVRRPDFDNADPKFAGLYGRPMPFLFEEDAADYKARFEPQDKQFKDDWLARTCEIVDKYQPDLIWFDFGITAGQDTKYNDNHYAPYLQRFAAYYYNVSSKNSDSLGIINYKWQAFPEDAAVLDLERSKMDSVREPFWQTDTAISSSSWGYTENQKYKSAGRLVDDLVDIVSKNGCLLLNVGPRADGTIPAQDREILLSIGKWLKVNGEAIYETTHWKTYGEGPTKTSTGHLAESKDQPFTAEDIRFTSKRKTLYAILLDWPHSQRITIKSLATDSATGPSKIESVILLGSNDEIVWTRDESGLHITLPSVQPCEYAFTLKIQ